MLKFHNGLLFRLIMHSILLFSDKNVDTFDAEILLFGRVVKPFGLHIEKCLLVNDV